MATSTRPFLITGAALASAAAIVAATPQLMPSVSAPSPLALSQAQVDLTSFADLLALTPADYTNAYFQGYGGLVGNLEYKGQDDTPPKPYPGGGLIYNDPYAGADWNIWWGSCAAGAGKPGNCAVAGLSGIAYQALDALINGGSDNVGALNYYFEAGLSAGSTYLLQSSIGAANPILSTLITLIEAGPQLVTQIWNTAWSTVATLVNAVPLVGPFVAGGIYAYLGFGPDGKANGYTPGLSGVLNYVIDLATGNPNRPYPPVPQAPASAAVAAPLTRTVAGSATEAPRVEVTAAGETEAAGTDTGEAKAEAKAEANAEVKAEVTADPAPASESASASGAGSATPVADKAADTPEAPALDAPAAGQTETAAETAPAKSEPAAKPRKRPVRDAVEKVAAGIGSALKGAAKAGSAGSTAESAADAS